MEDKLRIIIRTKNPEQLRKLLREYELDIAEGGLRKNESGLWELEAFPTISLAEHLEKTRQEHKVEFQVEVDRDFPKRLKERQEEVSRVDRFENGQILPRGLGKKIKE
jgi:hypothetical protein